MNLINDAKRTFTQGFEDFKAIHEDCAGGERLVLRVLTHFVKVGFCCSDSWLLDLCEMESAFCETEWIFVWVNCALYMSYLVVEIEKDVL